MLLLNNSQVMAQFVYPNDICSGAMPIPVSNNGQLSDSVFQRNAYANPAISAIPDCAGSTSNTRYDLWYSFTAIGTTVTIVAEHLTGSGLLYQLFEGNCDGLTSLQCGEGRPNSTFPTFTGLVAGKQYYLRSYGLNLNGESNASNYKLSLLAKPVNDDCTGAVLLNINPANAPAYTTNRFSNAQATIAPDVSCASNGGWATLKDLWYKFVATKTNHDVFINLPPGITRVDVYRGAPGGFVNIGLLNGGSGSIPLKNLTIGDTYYIRIGATTEVFFNIGIFQNTVSNDECVNADTVRVGSTYGCDNNFAVNLLGSTVSTVTCNQSTTGDVWYIFKATVPDIKITSTGDGSSNLKIGLLSGSCGTFTCLANNNSTLSYSELTVGNYYYLKVTSSLPERSSFLCISPKITNDECNNAFPLSVKPYNVLRTTVGDNSDATQSMPGCQTGSTILDVWYRFTATDTACLITVDAAKTSSTRFEVLTGECGSLNSIFCSSTTAIPANASERTVRVGGLVAGNSYYVRNYTTNQGIGLFTIDINSLPANDTCTGAVILIPQQGLAYETMRDNGMLYASTSQPPCAAAAVTNDIWYKFTATQNSMGIISNMETSASILGYQLYSGGCGSLTNIGCIQQGAILHKAQTFTGMVPGQTYFIRQYGNTSTNRITIIEKPVNDEISGAIQLTVTPSNVQALPSYYLHGTSTQFGKICSNATYNIYHDVWFYFIAKEANHIISTSALNSFWDEQIAGYTYRLEAFKGYGGDSTALAAKAIGCGLGSLALGGLTAGDTVYVRIANTAAEGNTSIFSVKITNTQNIDEPQGALVLTELNTYQYSLNTAGATQSLPAGGCNIQDFPDDDIWLKFTASATAKRIIAGFDNRDITLQLFSGTPGNLVALQCSINILVLPAGLTNGALYYVRAYSKANALAATFQIGLFGEDDPMANNSTTVCLGPNLLVNPRCESEYKYLLPKNDNGATVAGRKLAEGWWSGNEATADAWDADYPSGEWGDLPGAVNSGIRKIPRSGKGVLGVFYQGTGWNEYATGKLKQPMEPGKTYLVSFYVSLDDSYPVVKLFNIGAQLGMDSIVGNGLEPLEMMPHVTHPAGSPVTEENGWRNISGLFYADKPYSFITIGNFGPDGIYNSSNNAYFFIDDVVVAEVNCTTLPLSLLNFNGKINASNQTELNWQTAEEINTKNFAVEWRTDGRVFTTIGTVAAKGNQYNAYNFLHQTPADGYNYYRLKMMDNDGRFTYSSIVKTGNKFTANNIMVYPNPVSTRLNITAKVDKDELVFFRLMNVEGKVVATKSMLLVKGSNVFTWNIVQVAAGNYIISSTNKTLQAVQIIKQ